MHDFISLHQDAFSSGQISSKLWLCEQLESISFSQPQTIWIYGGWYGILGFLLLARNKISINKILSFDQDDEASYNADKICENWVWQEWKFKAFREDCNQLDPKQNKYDSSPDIVINTSTEHFDTNEWFDNIPNGTLIALQNNNMPNNDHVNSYSSIDEFAQAYKLSRIIYQDSLHFHYPTWHFDRYMIIGYK